MKDCWCIPPKHNAEFVAKMEDVLAVYARPYNSENPVICMDEKPYTPKHGSWLNIAEIELSALAMQCLGKRHIPTVEELNQNLFVWQLS